ncbi:hypothetical protein FB565_000213 [Actinoplanes lutulentus]|uniref:ARB-07466-like C-terminal domain-containing protein n=1 Tax=Actinoplanes lutulentus TaxID=1287878 RepID=A0A327YZT5_9ACTN|nr:hypothetical protein [Actinoplanes lutulentus]MBB2940509.1 hypothetical protein [Actinoplanes lutulentus]RAK25491.1 hypothetical protein B0I29_13330 [Actinoplanes lutulentus]
MTKAVTGIVIAMITAVFGLPALLLTSIGGSGANACANIDAPGIAPSEANLVNTAWDADQLAIAETIVSVGITKKVPRWGWTIALAVAMQESRLRNLPHLGGRNNYDSIGVFQQRPSQGWGTAEQISQPAYQAEKFYDKLLSIPDWDTMPLAQAAQAVQISAFPDAYAKWEPEAVQVVDAISDAVLVCSTLGLAVPAPRNSDGSWPQEQCNIRPDPTTGAGCVTPRLLHLVQEAKVAGFPRPSCYRIDDHGEHPTGQACDWMMTAGGEATGAEKTRGDAMAAWAIANADRLGIRYVIWFRMIWTDDEGWHAYSNAWGGNDPYGWHTNHVHISIR